MMKFNFSGLGEKWRIVLYNQALPGGLFAYVTSAQMISENEQINKCH